MKIVRKVGDRGQVTIPKEVREVMEIHDGDIVEFELIAVHAKKKEKRVEPPRAERRNPGKEAAPA